MGRQAILHDEYRNDEGVISRCTKEFQVPDHAPKELVQPERITGERQDGVEYVYRMRGINKAGIASYAYHSSRQVRAGFRPSPRLVKEEQR